MTGYVKNLLHLIAHTQQEGITATALVPASIYINYMEYIHDMQISTRNNIHYRK